MSEKKDRFVIRAHHIRFVAYFDPKGSTSLSPVDRASEFLEGYRESRDYVPRDGGTPYHELRRTYSRDLIGDTPSSEKNFRETTRDFFRNLRELPDDHPVEIVVGRRDEWCRAAAIGDHCATSETAQADIADIERFQGSAKRHGIGPIEVSYEEVRTTEPERTFRAPTLRAALGTVRRVVREI